MYPDIKLQTLPEHNIHSSIIGVVKIMYWMNKYNYAQNFLKLPCYTLPSGSVFVCIVITNKNIFRKKIYCDIRLMIDCDVAEKRFKKLGRDVKLQIFKHTLATNHIIQCPTL